MPDAPADVIKKPVFAVFTMIGGVLILAGSFLPWATQPRSYYNGYSWVYGYDHINGFSGGNPEGVFFLVLGAAVAGVGVARKYADLWWGLQRLPLLLASITGYYAYLDIQGVRRYILDYPGAYVGAGWWVMYIGVAFAVIGALGLDERVKPPLPPLRPPTPPQTPRPTPLSPPPVPLPSSTVADIPGRPLSDWDEELLRRDEAVFNGQPADCARLAQVLAVLGAVLGGIAMFGQSIVGGIVIIVVAELGAAGLWLIGRRQARAS